MAHLPNFIILREKNYIPKNNKQRSRAELCTSPNFANNCAKVKLILTNLHRLVEIGRLNADGADVELQLLIRRIDLRISSSKGK